jgi:hypothetical protein
VIVSINEGENEDDMISNPTPVGEGFGVEHEQPHPMARDSAPHRYWNELFYI